MSNSNLFYTMTDTQLVNDVTFELRMGLGFAIRDTRKQLSRMTLSDRSNSAVSVVRSVTRVAELGPRLVGNIGDDAFDRGLRISTPAFAVTDTLMLAPELGQLIIRHGADSLNGQPLFGTISARRLARGIVSRCWSEGEEPDPVVQFVIELVLNPLEDLRQRIRMGA